MRPSHRSRRRRARLLAAASLSQHQEEKHTADHQQRHQIPAGEQAGENVEDPFRLRIGFGQHVAAGLVDALLGQGLGTVRIPGLQGQSNPLRIGCQHLAACGRRLRKQHFQEIEAQRQNQHQRRIVADGGDQAFQERVEIHQ